MRNIIAFVGLGLIAAFALGCGSKAPPQKAAPAASVSRRGQEGELVVVTLTPQASARLGITDQPASSRPMPRRRTAGGEVVVPSGGAVLLTAPIAATVDGNGPIATLGAKVKRGDPIVTLAPLAPVDRDLRAQADRASSSAETRSSAAEAKLARAERLLADGAGSARAVEEAKAERDVAIAERDAATARRSAMATNPLAADMSVTLRAPHDGVVQRIGVTRGQLVAPGALLVELVGTSALWVRVPLFASDAHAVRPERPARVFAFGADAKKSAGHEALPINGPPSADPLLSTVDVLYVLGPEHGLRPGERVLVEVEQGGDEPRVVVPRSALVYDFNGGAWVYEARGGLEYVRHRVAVERIEGDDAVLVSGPKEGTRTVIKGVAELWGVEFGAGK